MAYRQTTVLDTPIGGIGVFASDGVVTGVSFGAAATHDESGDLDPILARAVAELADYFAGERLEFSVATEFVRGSEFERAVWAQIAGIPYGETRSYGSLAHAVGEPGGAQAVGLACNRNPLPLIIPCHRVIGSDGKLVGFGGGLHRKRWLLELEARIWIEHSFAP